MSKCEHLNAKFSITITRAIDAYIQTSEIRDNVAVTSETPTNIRVAVSCADCNHVGIYNAYNNFHPIAAQKWPTWLLNRLIPLRARNAAVQEACLACDVPPSNHPSWPLLIPQKPYVIVDYGHGWQLVEQQS